MKLALLILLGTIGAAGGLTWNGPAAAQVPGTPCNANTYGDMTMRTIWVEEANSWAVAEIQCSKQYRDDGSFLRYRWTEPRVAFWTRSEDKPDGWHYAQGEARDAGNLYQVLDSTPLARPPAETNYWDTDISRQMQRNLSQHVYAGNICAALTEPGAFVEGVSIDTNHVYRVGKAWHYIPNQADREAFNRPAATMARIWGYDYVPTSTPGTYALRIKIPSCHSQELWDSLPEGQ